MFIQFATECIIQQATERKTKMRSIEYRNTESETLEGHAHMPIPAADIEDTFEVVR